MDVVKDSGYFSHILHTFQIITATNFENSVTLGNAVKLKDGVEKINYKK